MKSKVLVLGCGASLGVPPIHHPNAHELILDPMNSRLRTSVLCQIGEKKILIDPGPDFRAQAIRFHIQQIDAVLITHTHFDHIGGIDELRAYYFAQKKPLPIFLSQDSYDDLAKRYHYLIDQTSQVVNKDQKFLFKILPGNEGIETFQEIPIHYFSYYQAKMKVTGYRIGNFAYITDIKEYEPSIFDQLKNLDVLMVSALRRESSPVHLSLGEAVAFASKVNAKNTYFIHTTHELEYHTTNAELPHGIALAYDGLEALFWTKK
jgi:phosphoribosyl 1,2-cyclic phosphate phosphodiesterase